MHQEIRKEMPSSPLKHRSLFTTKTQIGVDPCGPTKVPPMPNMNMGPNSNIVRRVITQVMSE